MDAPEIRRADSAKITTNGLSPIRARQGVISGRVLTVSLASVPLGALAVALCYFAAR
jgi:hypothetical protein